MKAKPFPDAFAQVLREQQITETEPGPILHDFGVFLDFIAANHPVASPKNYLLPQAWFRRAWMEMLGNTHGRGEAGMLSDCFNLWHRFREKGFRRLVEVQGRVGND